MSSDPWSATTALTRFGVVAAVSQTRAVLAVAVGAGILSWITVGIVRRYAIAKSILDIPNHRSSHVVPTPRGGGAGLAASFLIGMVALECAGTLPTREFVGIAGGALLIALIGWIDDRRGVTPIRRAMIQLAAAGWAVWWIGGLPSVTIGAHQLILGWLGIPVATLTIVWCTNLYNFMDGIDGIAAGQAATSGIMSAVLLSMNDQQGLSAVAILASACSAGFLVWNWSPAKIFMGDVGSSMLGFVFAAVAVSSQSSGTFSVLQWLLLGGVFVLDATVTLVRRAARGQKWYEPHRSHAYQRAVQSGMSHATVSAGVMGINLFFGMLLIATAKRPHVQALVVAAGLTLLVALYMNVERTLPMFSRFGMRSNNLRDRTD